MDLSNSSSTNAVNSPFPFPLRLGDRMDFERIRLFFNEAGFSEERICSILKIESLANLHGTKLSDVDWSVDPSPLLILSIRLFLLAEHCDSAELKSFLKEEIFQSFLNLDLLRPLSANQDRYGATVLLYPVQDLLIVSDRLENPFKNDTPISPDVVFPAIHLGARVFLQILPDSPVSTVLDLCSGTGVAAILASRNARQVVAADLAPRANHFARFNCLLNGASQVEILESDLYEGLEGRSFDRILCHPPYVPALSPMAIYRDGGQTGEVLVRKIIQQLPEHLNIGGTFFAVLSGLDTQEGAYEKRVRDWLGNGNNEFDILFIRKEEKSPQEFIQDLMWAQRQMSSSEVSQWQEIFQQIGATNMPYGALAIHRRINGTLQPWTYRTMMSPKTRGSEIEWTLQWRQLVQGKKTPEWLAPLHPRLAPGLRVTVNYSVENNQLAPSSFVVSSDVPFLSESRIEPSMATILSEFDGKKTLEQIYQEAHKNKLLPTGLPLAHFLNLMAIFIERGYLIIEQPEISQII
jgi:methylase of polypeptide subunit release factors